MTGQLFGTLLFKWTFDIKRLPCMTFVVKVSKDNIGVGKRGCVGSLAKCLYFFGFQNNTISYQ
jgi:hypothetical protein